MSSTVAPGKLELVESFINTIEHPEEIDELEQPGALAAWLQERGLLDEGASVSARALAEAQELREALRSLCFANNGEGVDPGATAVLEATAERAGLGVRFSTERARLEPQRSGIDGALGRLLAIVAEAMADGTWSRLKACRSDECRWVFYDASRNHSATWCSMEVCGNRAKARAFRSRQRSK